jgi:outer membrane protein OmpA-like peptidoglycan-associated protein
MQSVVINRRLMLSALLVLCFGALSASAQQPSHEPKTYRDSRGRKVFFPLGDASFVGELVSFQSGTPAAKAPPDPKVVLGSPDFVSQAAERKRITSLPLGCGGTLILRFTHNVLVDAPGPDLYVFEVGPAVEPTALAISNDGKTWIDAGRIRGGTAEVDIRKVTKPGERYRFVRLTDLKTSCSGAWPGADIDAVGAIGAALAITFDSSVLFDFDKSILKPAARDALTEAAAKIAANPGADITVEGHTDSDGRADYNLKLSKARADAVVAFLKTGPSLAQTRFRTAGYGASRPIADNATPEGREQNRRVEIIITPAVTKPPVARP